MPNDYTGIAGQYDLIMSDGYFDHGRMAAAAEKILGGRTRILEIGVGTGLLADRLTADRPDRQFTGVDFTPAMLEIARQRLGIRARLIEADVINMALGETFDAVVSSGGVWYVVDNGGANYELSSHIPGLEDNVAGLRNLAAHLKPGGLLLISIQETHRNYGRALPDGAVYSQEIDSKEDGADFYCLEKRYFVHKDGELVGQNRITFAFFRGEAHRAIMSNAGFQFTEVDPDNQFMIYTRV
jgi:SAM-dependent methyltransferase